MLGVPKYTVNTHAVVGLFLLFISCCSCDWCWFRAGAFSCTSHPEPPGFILSFLVCCASLCSSSNKNYGKSLVVPSKKITLMLTLPGGITAIRLIVPYSVKKLSRLHITFRILLSSWHPLH
jgi:hypothetical protein